MNRTTILTATGREIDLASPSPGQIEIEDVAHALARVSRFGGHYATREFFSVARHSLAVATLLALDGAPTVLRLAGLLHDASEAYLGDVVRPLKRILPEYVKIEEAWQNAIERRFGLPLGASKWRDVKEADETALWWESANCRPGLDLGPNATPWSEASGFSRIEPDGALTHPTGGRGIRFPGDGAPLADARTFLAVFSDLCQTGA